MSASRITAPVVILAVLTACASAGGAPGASAVGRGGAVTRAGVARPAATTLSTPPAPRMTLSDSAALVRVRRDILARIAMVPGTVSVMLIDLKSGGRVAIDADHEMHAASTMKVPVLLELFRQADEGRFSLDDSVTVSNTFTSIADGSTYHLSPNDDSELALYRMVGRRVTLRDLAFRMITASSNLATDNLIGLVTPDSVQALMRRMGTQAMIVLRGVEDIPAFNRGMNDRTTARALAEIFVDIARCERGERLAALAPLGPAGCREITGILAKQEFNAKIPAGIPAGIRVAHKTGWITGIRHDAGLVYPPGQPPYALAILTHGFAKPAVADSVARDISSIVWRDMVEPRITEPLPADSLRDLWSLARRYRVPGLEHRDFDHATYWHELGPIIDHAADLSRDSIGASAEGRTLWAVRFGHGPTHVLLWSQMHGNESTATMALADIFHFLAAEPDSPLARELADRLTVVAVPMLNPDGAQRFQRRDALGIDINRDARALASPEARALKALYDSFQPQFGFNLHDQNVRTRVGMGDATAAISLLAPAFSTTQESDAVRARAERVAASIRLAIEPFVAAHITRYDATFNPRAFGDLMTLWGTSTVLIESGGWTHDPEKQYLRRVNVVAMLAALDVIATSRYAAIDADWYATLPRNGDDVADLLIRGGTIVLPDLAPYRADIAVRFAEPLRRTGGRVADVGDLVGGVARDTLDASGLFIHPASGFPLEALKTTSLVGLPADFVLTAAAHGGMPVWLIRDGRPERAER